MSGAPQQPFPPLAQLRAVDALAVAERIVRQGQPKRAAIAASTIEVIALADRLLNLEEAAARAYQLLVHIDELEAIPGPGPGREAALRETVRTLIRQLTDGFALLGYYPDDPETMEDASNDTPPAHT